MLLTFLTGMGTGGGLIIAIDPQNAFDVILIPLICAVC